MLSEVWSGGQIGADIAGLRAALGVGLQTGGWIPRGFRTDDGPHPEYADLYRLTETRGAAYPARTIANVRACDATFLIGDNPDSPGCALTRLVCEQTGKPWLSVTIAEINLQGSEDVAARWLESHYVQRLNIAGNRDAPEVVVEVWLQRVFNVALKRP